MRLMLPKKNCRLRSIFTNWPTSLPPPKIRSRNRRASLIQKGLVVLAFTEQPTVAIRPIREDVEVSDILKAFPRKAILEIHALFDKRSRPCDDCMS